MADDLWLAKAMEHMVVDSLVLANNALEISESIKNPRKFIFLTDDRLMGKIEESEGDVRPVLIL